MDWTPPGEDGKQTCPDHPESGRFGAEGCAVCIAAGPAQLAGTLGEGESIVAAAGSLGVWNGIAWTHRAQSDYQFATARKERMVAKADELLDSMDPDERADGIRAESAAAKWADTAAKLEKLAKGAVDLWERMAAKEKRDRLLKSLGVGN